MRKPTICICENKDADQLRGYPAKLISAFVFAKRIVQSLFYKPVKLANWENEQNEMVKLANWQNEQNEMVK